MAQRAVHYVTGGRGGAAAVTAFDDSYVRWIVLQYRKRDARKSLSENDHVRWLVWQYRKRDERKTLSKKTTCRTPHRTTPAGAGRPRRLRLQTGPRMDGVRR
jgi:hypothetical protein